MEDAYRKDVKMRITQILTGTFIVRIIHEMIKGEEKDIWQMVDKEYKEEEQDKKELKEMCKKLKDAIFH